MAEHSRSKSQGLNTILGLGTFSKIYKKFISKCRNKKNSSSEADPKSTKEECQAHEYERYKHVNKNVKHGFGSPRKIVKNQNHENNYFTRSPQSTTPSELSRSSSPFHSGPLFTYRSDQRSQTLMRKGETSLLRNSSIGSSSTSTLSRSTSRRSSTLIMYSNSNGVVKPPAMAEILQCTLEELCFGCIKKIKTTRNGITDDGQIIAEDEVLTIEVKPGWKNGTKITFERMGNGNETPPPNKLYADIIFTIVEKQHHFFKRESDHDLELAVEISLLEALTGCSLQIPLLDGEKMNLTIDDDIIHPGYKKIIEGQGMAKPHEEQGERGNLIITFFVEFPIKLPEQQCSGIISILQNSF